MCSKRKTRHKVNLSSRQAHCVPKDLLFLRYLPIKSKLKTRGNHYFIFGLHNPNKSFTDNLQKKMKSKTGPSHVEDRGSSRAESLDVAYTSAMFDAQWSQLLNLLKFPSQCPEFARNRKDPTFYILLIWTLLDFLPTLPPCSYLYSRCFRHTTA